MIDSKFKHSIIDDFFEMEDLQEILTNLRLANLAGEEIKIFLYSENREGSDLLKPEFAQYIASKYRQKALNVLEELAPKKVELVDYVQFTISVTPPNAKYPIHEDAHEKVLSGVVYLDPTESTGTFLHLSKQDKNPTEIEWRVNRAFFFSRQEGVSWHSYQGDGKKDRVTCVFNLMTNNPKKHLRLQIGIAQYLKLALKSRQR